MMNKYSVLISSLLFSVSASEGMFKKDKDKKHFEHDNKNTIHNLDDVKKLKEDQLEYRSKHKVFKDEPNDVAAKMIEKK
jgi:hypothetical protein